MWSKFVLRNPVHFKPITKRNALFSLFKLLVRQRFHHRRLTVDSWLTCVCGNPESVYAFSFQDTAIWQMNTCNWVLLSRENVCVFFKSASHRMTRHCFICAPLVPQFSRKPLILIPPPLSLPLPPPLSLSLSLSLSLFLFPTFPSPCFFLSPVLVQMNLFLDYHFPCMTTYVRD